MRNVVGLDFVGAHVGGDVSDQALAVVGHDFVGGCGGHDDVVGGDDGVGWILRKRALIEAVGNLLAQFGAAPGQIGASQRAFVVEEMD